MTDLDPTAIAQRLYDAFAAHDGEALLTAMTEDFVGTVSAGMPLGVGGRHEGRETMLRDCWAQVFINYDMAVEPDRYLICSPDEVVVLGSYRGTVRATGDPVDARFAHILTLRDGRVAALEQITDTRSWAEAPAAAA
jgi:2-(1,2-epoxy-1,2-dihydrophenyl)acetyl-CoA isomerase